MTIHQFRKRLPHACPICGQVFEGLKTAKFCSNRCRQAAKYQRQKAAKAVKEE
jgi:predicted nucleic acid-binding Zn ribbon protein